MMGGVRLDARQEIKALIREYPYLQDRIFTLNKKLSEINKLKLLYPDTVKASAPRDDCIQRTGVSDPVFQLITRYDDEIEDYTTQINRLMDKKETY